MELGNFFRRHNTTLDENELREEARGLIKNVKEGTVEYEMAFQRSLKQVKKRRGLI